jgi:pyrimidine-nucleoside phosphorylase
MSNPSQPILPTPEGEYRAVELIRAARDRRPLPQEAIVWFINAFLAGKVADYQMSAWLMAVTLNGLSAMETFWLTEAMHTSGAQLDWSGMDRPVADKHSTGGVGDKISLVAVPVAAAAGLAVPKISGRGLGFTGGTLDKLEAIPGLRTGLSLEQIRRQAEAVGCVIAAPTADLVPADKRIYALRDLTATVESAPLVASSVMSKKLAGGAPAIVLDVKVGDGAMMASEAEARSLAEMMVAIGEDAGRRVVAVLSRMSEPLGAAVGNALEVREAIEALQGEGPEEIRDLSLTLAGWMLHLAGLAPGALAGKEMAAASLAKGQALERFRALVVAQGGDPAVVDDPRRLPQAPVQEPLFAEAEGWVGALDAREVGLAAMALGAGREGPGAPVDPAVGIMVHRKAGDRIQAGELLATVHARTGADAAGAAQRLRAAYRIAPEPPPVPPLVLDVIGSVHVS